MRQKEHVGLLKALESLTYTNFIMCQRSAANKKEAEGCIKPPNWSQ